MKRFKAVLSLILALIIVSGSVVVSFADDVTEKEPDNSKETAAELDVEPNDNKESAGKLNNPDKYGASYFTGSVSSEDEDWFSFTCEMGYFYCVIEKTGDGEGSVTADFFILDGSADRLITSVTASETGKPQQSATVGVDEGTYYFRIT